MGECEKCGLVFRGKCLKRIQTGTHFGKPIYKKFCFKCRREVNKKK